MAAAVSSYAATGSSGRCVGTTAPRLAIDRTASRDRSRGTQVTADHVERAREDGALVVRLHAAASSTRVASWTSGRYTAPATVMLRTDAGTSETPSPAATKLTSVAVSPTSCGGERHEAVRGARVLDGVVDEGTKLRRVGHERRVAQDLERHGVRVGERM